MWYNPKHLQEAKTKAATIETHTTTFEEFVEEQREDVAFNTRRANTLGTVKEATNESLPDEFEAVQVDDYEVNVSIEQIRKPFLRGSFSLK